MNAEVIKLRSTPNENIQQILSSLSRKLYAQHPYDITLILKHNEQIAEDHLSLSNIDELETQSVPKAHPLPFLENQPPPPPLPPQGSKKYHSQKNIHFSSNYTSNNKENCHNLHQTTASHNNFGSQTSKKVIDENFIRIAEKDEEAGSSQIKRTRIQISNISVVDSGEENESQLGLLVEGKLNKALQFLNNSNDVGELEIFLYEFKEKHAFMTPRTQAKWNLLMAHCKEQKLEYERAASYYKQITEMLEVHPMELLVSLADAYHSLALCYYKIQEYNLSIAAFVRAADNYRGEGNRKSYSSALNNLGAVYLSVDYAAEAEKCFVLSYQIRKDCIKAHDNWELNGVLFNILECNLRQRNLEQSENILNLIGKNKEKGVEAENERVCRYYSKRSQLQLLRGDLAQAQRYSEKVESVFVRSEKNSLLLGQISEMSGILHLECNNYKEAKYAFSKALKIMRDKHFPQDSPKMEVLESNVEMLMNKINKGDPHP